MELIGTWTLEAFEVVAGDGAVSTPFGEAPLGRIMYGADGTMSAMLCAPDREPFGARAGEASDAQWAEVARMFVAYAGTWSRDGDVVRHQVAIALIPDWIGTTMERAVGERDGRLTLTVEPRTPGGRAQRLIWARAS
ncbi:lipocalin-like domain-containing protein [Sporichthya sp.]|uniref:lipocalin-like domain-containing protein n=1 Tax=Sporichthya sp. TaxID=65475 RepID=UPI0017912846|nr:lipocalin-like domain-containing protein [Sporichthya sp.]MBA3745072.1 lipocalin-like domain-containing protein [Sporichthya sp.]